MLVGTEKSLDFLYLRMDHAHKRAREMRLALQAAAGERGERFRPPDGTGRRSLVRLVLDGGVILAQQLGVKIFETRGLR